MTTKIAETTIYHIPLTSTMKQMAGRVQTNDKKPLAKSPIADRITAISSLRSTVSNVLMVQDGLLVHLDQVSVDRYEIL